jgi:hypothetical protein
MGTPVARNVDKARVLLAGTFFFVPGRGVAYLFADSRR